MEPNKISKEDMAAVAAAKANVARSTLEAEKAVALQRVFKLELENIILRLYHKYNIVPGSHTITEDGIIINPPQVQKIEEIKTEEQNDQD